MASTERYAIINVSEPIYALWRMVYMKVQQKKKKITFIITKWREYKLKKRKQNLLKPKFRGKTKHSPSSAEAEEERKRKRINQRRAIRFKVFKPTKGI